MEEMEELRMRGKRRCMGRMRTDEMEWLGNYEDGRMREK